MKPFPAVPVVDRDPSGNAPVIETRKLRPDQLRLIARRLGELELIMMPTAVKQCRREITWRPRLGRIALRAERT